MTDDSDKKTQKDLWRVIVVATSIGFGVLASFLYAFDEIWDNPTAIFSFGSMVAFVVGAVAGWAFWRIIRLLAERNEKQG